jgi:hypothetical protein
MDGVFTVHVTLPVTLHVDHRAMTLKDPEARRQYHRAYMRGWYQKNREIHMARVMKTARERKARMDEFVDQFKRRPCLDCSGRFPTYVMDFDHVRGSKVGILSRMRRARSRAKVVAEIAKCEVVCSNCHRIRTGLRRDGSDVLRSQIAQMLGPNYVSVFVY